jgi:hypothetical protein
MSDTHINAYFEDVEQKKEAVKLAKAELQEAEDRLAVKKQEVDFEEPSEKKESKPQSTDKSDKDDKTEKSANGFPFKHNK